MVLLAAAVILFLMVTTSLVGILVGLRPIRSKGAEGEKQVKKRLEDLNPELYRVFHDLYLPRADGTGLTQVDHVVISRFGVFVLETKNYEGWIFGSARQKMWTQSIFGRNRQFPNPLHQNHLHVQAVKALLGLVDRKLHSLVFFVDGDFRTEMPENVICSDLCGWIASHRGVMLDDAMLHDAILKMEELEKQTDRKTARVKHLQQLKERDRQGPRVTGERDLPGEIAEILPPPLPPSPWSGGVPDAPAAAPVGAVSRARSA